MTDRLAWFQVLGLVRISGAVACRQHGRLEQELRRGKSELPPLAVEEVLLQSYLFVGYPAALTALTLWREIGRTEPPPPSEDDWAAWSRRGRRVCQAVYGAQYPRLRERVRALHPDLERWMLAEGYGKVLGRPGLALRDRELAIAAQLAVMDVPVQLHSHLRGALSVGATTNQVEEVLVEVEDFQTPEIRGRTREVWTRVRGRVERLKGENGCS